MFSFKFTSKITLNVYFFVSYKWVLYTQKFIAALNHINAITFKYGTDIITKQLVSRCFASDVTIPGILA